jgi:DNA-directed RNA polymerase subunit RPC12/RpoP
VQNRSFPAYDKENDMTKQIPLLALAIVLIPAMAALAGMDYPMKCTNCGYSSRVQIGGGRGFEQITGYCTESKKFVYLRWDRGKKKPEPMAKVWDSATGRIIEVYKCPDCAKPFIPLRVKAPDTSGPGFDHCPKCGKRTFQVDKDEGIIAFD